METAIKDFFEIINVPNLVMPTVSITSILDIAIVAFIIYIVLIFIKETRAWSLFKGIIVILAVSALAFLLHLYALSKIIETTFNVGLIALIVLFQPELRKALESIGKGDFLTSIVKIPHTEYKISENSVEEIIVAIRKMAKARTGALLVVEQSVALGDLEQTGILIDANITSQLLVNIFEDKTPLHDGAVIIRNNRIAAASCILPLTSNEIGKELGTRHRAGVGASEVSDGLVIIVSEETGNISISRSGKLQQKITEDQLRNLLIGISPKKSKNIFLKKGVNKNEANN